MSDVSGKMLWFGFTFGSNFTFLSLKLIITQTKENKTPFTLASHADVLLARHAILRGAGTRDELLRGRLRPHEYYLHLRKFGFFLLTYQRFSIEVSHFITKIFRLFCKTKSPEISV